MQAKLPSLHLGWSCSVKGQLQLQLTSLLQLLSNHNYTDTLQTVFKHTNIMPQVLNPILPGFNPDPNICRVGEDYW